jgi:DNA-binding CsgD family transcriptional regulator
MVEVVDGARDVNRAPGSYADSGPLTPRLVTVVAGAAAGESIAETAARLHLSRATVDAELRAAYARLGARNRSHAVALALRRGIIQ